MSFWDACEGGKSTLWWSGPKAASPYEARNLWRTYSWHATDSSDFGLLTVALFSDDLSEYTSAQSSWGSAPKKTKNTKNCNMSRSESTILSPCTNFKMIRSHQSQILAAKGPHEAIPACVAFGISAVRRPGWARRPGVPLYKGRFSNKM